MNRRKSVWNIFMIKNNIQTYFELSSENVLFQTGAVRSRVCTTEHHSCAPGVGYWDNYFARIPVLFPRPPNVSFLMTELQLQHLKWTECFLESIQIHTD